MDTFEHGYFLLHLFQMKIKQMMAELVGLRCATFTCAGSNGAIVIGIHTVAQGGERTVRHGYLLLDGDYFILYKPSVLMSWLQYTEMPFFAFR